jgi:hypothetical protein
MTEGPRLSRARLPEPARRGGDLPERVQRAGARQRAADLPGAETAVLGCQAPCAPTQNCHANPIRMGKR